MTREEAIKIIDCYDIGFYDLSGEKIPADKLADAFDMAIEALSEVRCNDCKWNDAVIRDDDKFYKGLYEMSCKVVEGQAEAMKTYHKIFLLQEAELNKLREGQQNDKAI